IDVCDTGPGLPDKARAHLFVPFAGSARSGGTGLGLAIADELARGHGGAIAVLTTGEKGTTFRVCIPAEDSMLDCREAERQNASKPGVAAQ
ncbi:MAG: HAMP domain-containing sensor histidine kinase, partial [Parvibaculum sedimenti]|uniref:sensor histidine kinase n=1 Tax=Parvibaculum sedimenti TaxID=2608632 RepID=UPI003BB58223